MIIYLIIRLKRLYKIISLSCEELMKNNKHALAIPAYNSLHSNKMYVYTTDKKIY